MAKAKQPEQISDGIEAFDASITAPDVDAEKAELRAKIAELEEQLLERETRPVQAYSSGPKRFFRVELLHCPTRVVEATDPANAFSEYRRASGILTTDYQPSITEAKGPCGRFLPDDRFVPVA